MSLARWFWGVWLLSLLLRLWLAATVPLFGDEAWYWLEGRHLAWAYSELPGLTAWLARAGSTLLPGSAIGVRLLFVALGAAVPLVLRSAARRVGEGRHADHVGLLALLMPLLGGASWLALPDGPMTFATALCLLAMLRLRRDVDATGAVLLGLGLALGALSHYRFALLLAAGGIGLLSDPQSRRTLRDWRVLLAIAAGALAWWPLLHWNLSHDSAGLAFQFGERHPWQLHHEGWRLPLSQLVVLSPLLLWLLLVTWRETWARARHPGTPARMLLLFATVPLATYLVLAFFVDRERVSFHWMLQAWLPLLLLAPPVLCAWSRRWRIATVASAALVLLAVMAYPAIATWPAARARIADSRWYPDNFSGWDAIASEVARRLRDRPGLRLVADDFMVGAQLGFALQRDDIPVRDHPANHKHGRARQLQAWGLQHRFEPGSGEPALLVMEDGALGLRHRLGHYRALCAEAGTLASPQVLQLDHGRKRFLLFDGAGTSKGCVLPALAWIDEPAAGDVLGRDGVVSGWAFKDGAGIARVEVLLDGEVVAPAIYGLARPDVAGYWRVSTDPQHPSVGFEARLSPAGAAPGWHWLGLRLHGNDGAVEDWPAQRVRIGD